MLFLVTLASSSGSSTSSSTSSSSSSGSFCFLPRLAGASLKSY
jgi:hypothetical protein